MKHALKEELTRKSEPAIILSAHYVVSSRILINPQHNP